MAIIGVVGTVLPLAVLALMYLLALLPMTNGTVRSCACPTVLPPSHRVGALAISRWLSGSPPGSGRKLVARRDSGWKEIQLVRRINA
ncbi:MAG: hypothetical protein IPK05_13760 [Comamonadaceae bacterium]|nr:hypothetical protein [Comamonadaceae bacterium]